MVVAHAKRMLGFPPKVFSRSLPRSTLTVRRTMGDSAQNAVIVSKPQMCLAYLNLCSHVSWVGRDHEMR